MLGAYSHSRVGSNTTTTSFNASLNRRKIVNSALLPPDFFNNAESVESFPDPSPSKPVKVPNHTANEIDALLRKFARTLKGTLARVRQSKMSHIRRLTESDANFEFEEDEGLGWGGGDGGDIVARRGRDGCSAEQERFPSEERTWTSGAMHHDDGARDRRLHLGHSKP